MSTPSGAVVICRQADGTEIDITEGVQALYDLVTSSMDWGSGFLTAEDALPAVEVAKACGFEEWEQAQAYVDAQRHSEEQRLFLDHRQQEIREAFPRYREMPHDHVFSSVGKCMWPTCDAREGL